MKMAVLLMAVLMLPMVAAVTMTMALVELLKLAMEKAKTASSMHRSAWLSRQTSLQVPDTKMPISLRVHLALLAVDL
jgi:hypothetical protein